MSAITQTEWRRITNMRRNLDELHYGPENPTVAGCIKVLDKTADILGFRWDVATRVYRRKANENNG